MSLRRDVEKLVKLAGKQGFGVGRTGSGHVLVEREDGERVVVSSTPGDHRALKNARARLRRLGVKV